MILRLLEGITFLNTRLSRRITAKRRMVCATPGNREVLMKAEQITSYSRSSMKVSFSKSFSTTESHSARSPLSIFIPSLVLLVVKRLQLPNILPVHLRDANRAVEVSLFALTYAATIPLWILVAYSTGYSLSFGVMYIGLLTVL